MQVYVIDGQGNMIINAGYLMDRQEYHEWKKICFGWIDKDDMDGRSNMMMDKYMLWMDKDVLWMDKFMWWMDEDVMDGKSYMMEEDM